MKKVGSSTLATLGFLLLVVGGNANAVPVFSNSATVSSVSNSAEFTNISGSLLNYTEDGIIVSVNDSQCCFPNSHYGNGGNHEWVTISLVGGGAFNAIDFLLGDGWGAFTGHDTNLRWETFNGTTSTGTGVQALQSGTTVGWTDVDGITSIRVAANRYLTDLAFGDYQAIAIDDLRIGGATVPEPASILLLGLGLAGLGARKRHRALA